MRRSGTGSGGGLGMNKKVKVPVRVGQRAEAIREKGVAQIGTLRGDHSTSRSKILTGDVEKVRGAQRTPSQPGGVPLGNVTAAATVAGPGGSRNLYGQSGSQRMYGSPAGSARPQGRSFDAPPTKREGY